MNYELKDNQVYQFRLNKLFDRNNRPYSEEDVAGLVGPRKLFCGNASWQRLVELEKDVAEHIKRGKVILFSPNGYEHNTTDPFFSISGWGDKFSIATGNLVGEIKCPNSKDKLSITSRFGEQFLKYIIADADGFLPIAGGGLEKDGTGLSWLLPYLWRVKLVSAYRVGLPKRYVNREERIPVVRGNLDVLDYMISPRIGKYKCRYRKMSHRCPATALIAKVAQTIAKDANVRNIVLDNEMRSILRGFKVATEGFLYSKEQLLDAPYFSNPMYNDYNPVIDFSKYLLRHNVWDIGEDSESDSFLFDMSMLFEYFVRKTLIRAGFSVESKDKSSFLTIDRGLYDGSQRSLEPDLLIKIKDGFYLFDVKYKYFDTTPQIGGVDRGDIFQLHTYVGRYGAKYNIKGCGFIYPVKADRWESNFGFEDNEGCGVFKDMKICQHEKEIPFQIFFLKIPNSNNSADKNGGSGFEEFKEAMNNIKGNFKSRMEEFLK